MSINLPNKMPFDSRFCAYLSYVNNRLVLDEEKDSKFFLNNQHTMSWASNTGPSTRKCHWFDEAS